MAVTDADGIIYYRYVYDTYGELSDITTDDGVSLKSSEQLTEYRLAELAHATGIDYLYNGQYGVETDANGLYYMRARYYNQDIKRFINRDVVSGDISNSQSLNRYCYVQGNPVSLTDPFGLCPDPNSNFKNFCKFLYYTDWSAIGHAALDVAGLFWDGADVINALWYALEGNPEMAIASAIFAIPGAGIGIGNLMMKSEKLASAGKAVRAVSKFTQSAIGVGAGMSIATVGYQNLRHSIEAGEFSLTDLATFIGGLTIAAISGKGLISSGKDLLSCSDDLAKMWKNTKSRVSENFRKFMNDNGGFLDVDALLGVESGSKVIKTDEFFIDDWTGYPDAPRPDGPFKILEGTEYTDARNLANKTNANIHRNRPDLKGTQIHEMHPVKFGGSPTDIDNKIALSPKEHAKYTAFWNKVLREKKGK